SLNRLALFLDEFLKHSERDEAWLTSWMLIAHWREVFDFLKTLQPSDIKALRPLVQLMSESFSRDTHQTHQLQDLLKIPSTDPRALILEFIFLKKHALLTDDNVAAMATYFQTYPQSTQSIAHALLKLHQLHVLMDYRDTVAQSRELTFLVQALEYLYKKTPLFSETTLEGNEYPRRLYRRERSVSEELPLSSPKRINSHRNRVFQNMLQIVRLSTVEPFAQVVLSFSSTGLLTGPNAQANFNAISLYATELYDHRQQVKTTPPLEQQEVFDTLIEEFSGMRPEPKV
ncbi:MAG: hypothetical protein ACOYKA_06805, partial [Legionellaceae bacterium]